MTIWFDGEHELACSFEEICSAWEEPGATFVSILKFYPGLTTVNLVDEKNDSVTIKTNEGTMTRTNLVSNIEANRLRVEFDERYEAGNKVSATSHFVHEFSASETGVHHKIEIHDVVAPGVLGFFYRHLASGNIGKGFLDAYTARFGKDGA